MRKYLIILLSMLAAVRLSAQDDDMLPLIQQAEQEYKIGHVDQSRQMILDHLPQLRGTVRQAAYRLLSFCALADHDDAALEKYSLLLLDENPYYTPSLQDPQLFADLINTLKAGRNGRITTASRQAESLDEAPVSVTLITEEMIRLSTARNLQELLADYVPGMAIQEGYDVNLSMRGLMSSSQEIILIMRNGVRMNSYLSNEIPPDFRISLVNIKEIEVLHGAASSLYGNAALTAVVNIITKDAADVDGVQLSVGGGNAHTLKGDILFGRQFMDTGILLWGSIYNSRGTRWDIPADSPLDNYSKHPQDGYLYAGGYNHRPSYDLGMNLTWKDFTLYLSHQFGKRVATNDYINRLYPYDDAQTVDGLKPGIGKSTTTANLRYVHTWGPLTLEANVSGLHEHVMDYQPFVPTDGDKRTERLDSKSYMYGADMKAVYTYPASSLGQGNLLFGIQADAVNWYFLQRGIVSSDRKPIVYEFEDPEVNEQIVSPFVQLKHSFMPNLILNAGLRYDINYRGHGFDNASQLSPRVALIWKPGANTSLKLTYGRSFVDQSIALRNNRASYKGDPLSPHELNNLQFSSMMSFPRLHLQWESTLFYNASERFSNIDQAYFHTKVVGWENTLSYNHSGLKARLSTYMQHLTYSIEDYMGEEYPGSRWEIPDPNTCPKVRLNLQLSKSLCPGLWLTAKGSWAAKSDFCSLAVLYNPNDPDWSDEHINVIHLPSVFLMDASVRYTWRNLDFSLLCKNVFNTTYRIAGQEFLVLQQRRVLMATLSVNFKT